jgi:hypothetical protein
LRLGAAAKSLAMRGHAAGPRAEIMLIVTRQVEMRFAGD